MLLKKKKQLKLLRQCLVLEFSLVLHVQLFLKSVSKKRRQHRKRKSREREIENRKKREKEEAAKKKAEERAKKAEERAKKAEERAKKAEERAKKAEERAKKKPKQGGVTRSKAKAPAKRNVPHVVVQHQQKGHSQVVARPQQNDLVPKTHQILMLMCAVFVSARSKMMNLMALVWNGSNVRARGGYMRNA